MQQLVTLTPEQETQVKTKTPSWLTVAFAWLSYHAVNLVDQVKQLLPKRKMDVGGLIALAPILAVVGVVLATIIGVLILAALAPEFFNATSDLTDAFTNSGLTGTAGVIIGILAIVVPLILVFGFVALVVRVARKG